MITVVVLVIRLTIMENYIREIKVAEYSGVPLPELDRAAKVLCFRSLLRPFSGRGPATVSSHNWSRRPINGSGVF